jgi:hypothetical protein
MLFRPRVRTNEAAAERETQRAVASNQTRIAAPAC